jgi:hypothetical protein
MIDGKFDVIFRGQTMKNMPLDEVKANLVGLFKSSPEAVEKLFTGSEVAIKKSLDYTIAMKYQSALKKAGALALIKEVEAPIQPATQASATHQGKANFGVETPKPIADVKPQIAKSEVQPETKQPVEASASLDDEATGGEGDMSLAAVGAAIMPDKVYEKREVDTSELSLAAAGERILPKKAPEHHPQPSIEHLKLEN